MRRLPRTFGPLLFAAIQSAVTTAVATGVTTVQIKGPEGLVSLQWGQSWLMAWGAMLPLVMGMAPWLQRVVAGLTREPK